MKKFVRWLFFPQDSDDLLISTYIEVQYTEKYCIVERERASGAARPLLLEDPFSDEKS